MVAAALPNLYRKERINKEMHFRSAKQAANMYIL